MSLLTTLSQWANHLLKAKSEGNKQANNTRTNKGLDSSQMEFGQKIDAFKNSKNSNGRSRSVSISAANLERHSNQGMDHSLQNLLSALDIKPSVSKMKDLNPTDFEGFIMPINQSEKRTHIGKDTRRNNRQSNGRRKGPNLGF